MKKHPLSFLPPSAQKRLTEHAHHSLGQSFNLARKYFSPWVENIHLFYSIFSETGSMGTIIMKEIGIKSVFFKNHFGSVRKVPAQKPVPSLPSSQLKKTVIKAYSIAKDLGYGYVGTEHLTYALLESRDTDIQKMLSLIKKKPEKIIDPTRQKMESLFKNLFDDEENSLFPSEWDNPSERMFEQNHLGYPGLFEKKALEEIIKTKEKTPRSPYPFMEKFCENLSQRAEQEKTILIGRENELERMVHILGRKNKNNPLLIGEPGVGKTTIVLGLARRISQNKVPAFLLGKKIMSLDVATLVAGTSLRGEFESRLKEILREAKENKDLILFVDELHNIVGAGNQPGNLDLANIIKPALAEGSLRLIGATTFPEFKKNIAKDAALERRFQSITLTEPSPKETLKILRGIKKSYESFHNVSLSEKTLRLAVELSDRYIKNRFLPDKAIDVIDEAASEARNRKNSSDLSLKLEKMREEKASKILEKEQAIAQENYKQASTLKKEEQKLERQIQSLRKKHQEEKTQNQVQIRPGDIFKTIARISRISEEKISRTKSEKVKNLLSELQKKIVGQEEVLEKITYSLLRSQSGIEDSERPIGSFLFMGPTGVGKTYTAKTLACDFFSGEESFIRIDMSELSERHSLSSLIGSPAGYVGYGEGGRLTEKVRRNPYSVVLFDEIEKAHPDILNILLQILEDGKLTDAEGLEADFKNTLIILTTNIGTQDFTLAGKIGFSSSKNSQESSEGFESVRRKSLSELKKNIRPEILNRLDHILVFRPLNQKDILKIVLLEIQKLHQKLRKQKLSLNLDKASLNFLAKKSFSPEQGARLVRRNVRHYLENPLAEKIVFGKIKGKKLSVKAKQEKLKIT